MRARKESEVDMFSIPNLVACRGYWLHLSGCRAGGEGGGWIVLRRGRGWGFLFGGDGEEFHYICVS